MKKVDQVLIMAAGMGMRLGPLTENQPKALVTCAGWPLIMYALEFARYSLADGGDILVVAGYESDKLASYLHENARDVSVVINTEYQKGNIISLWKGLEALGDGDLLLMNVDHIYPYAFADKLASTEGDVVLAVDSDRKLGPDDMKVATDSQGRVTSISKKLNEYSFGYIGLTLVRQEALHEYKSAVRETMRRLDGEAVAEDVVQLLADQEFPIVLCDLSGLNWLEIDTLEDLQEAEACLYEDEDFLQRRFEHEGGISRD